MSGQGDLAILGIAFQNSGFTAANVNSIDFIPFISESVGADIPPLISEQIEGVYDESDTEPGPSETTGEIQAEAQPIPLGVLLKAVMGAPTSVQSDAIYAHTFSPVNTPFDDDFANLPFTLYKFLDVESAELFQDCCGNQLTLGISNGEFLKVTLGVVGGQKTWAGEESASIPQGRRWAWDVSSLQIGGAANADVRELTVTINENLENNFSLANSQWPHGVDRTGARTVEVSGTLRFRDTTEQDVFLNQTEQAMKLSLVGKTEIQSGYYDKLEFDIPALRYEELKPAAGGRGRIETSFTAKAKYHVGSGTAIDITLTNTRATY